MLRDVVEGCGPLSVSPCDLHRVTVVKHPNHHPVIRVCTCESLRDQPELCRLLQIMVSGGGSRSIASGRPEQVVILDRTDGDVACLGASVDIERIAMLGPILVHLPLETSERRALWQAAIEWALAQNPAAIQMACDGTTDDCEILSGLGYPITTEVGSYVCECIPWMVADDPLMATRNLDSDSDELVNLVQRTFVESLDIPEALPLRSPRQMIQGWIEDGDTWTLIAQSPEGPVGLLVAHRRAEGAEITYVGVIDGQRRRGWGTRLFGQFLKWARDASVTRISVIVDRRNGPAIQLYERFGFRAAEIWMPVVFHRMTHGVHSVLHQCNEPPR